MPETIDEQLVKHLTDVHSIEEQALQQMRVAPRLAHDRELAQAFREHITETEDHERRVRARLEARGADPSKVKDLVARAGDEETVALAERIVAEERAAAEAVREQFEPAVEASLRAQELTS